MAIDLTNLQPRSIHSHGDGRIVCEHCMSTLASSGSKFWDTVHEYVYVANEILLIVAQFVLIISMGTGMLLAAMFPTVVGRKTAYEENLDRQYKARKQRDWELLQKDKAEKQAYDEERDSAFKAHREKLQAQKSAHAKWSDAQDHRLRQELQEKYAREERDIDEYDRNKEKLNSASLNSPKLFFGTELAEDDYMVKKINNTLIGVEQGTDDAEQLRKLSEKLIEQRQDTANKDARRRELLKEYNDKDLEAYRLRCDADEAHRRGDYIEGDRLARRAGYAWVDAEALYNQFLSV